MATLTLLDGELAKGMEFPGWHNNPLFVICFLLSSIFGFMLIFSNSLCIYYNSPLTTAVIGAIKNIFITFFGMVYGGDYIFSWPNFVGIVISAIGSLFYTYVIIFIKKK